jgi:tripartite-type tricarboxylate transporter receptor subunit TctC
MLVMTCAIFRRCSRRRPRAQALDREPSARQKRLHVDNGGKHMRGGNLCRSTALRTDVVRLLLALLGCLLLAPIACAADYPERPIHLIVPFPPGGVADIIARPIAERLSTSLGQPVVVENRGGVTGTLGAGYVAHANPDGYTLLLGTTNEIAMSPPLYQSLPYDPTTAFAPITTVAAFPNILVVGVDEPMKTLADVVALARAKPNTVTFGSSGVGSTNHLTAEIFQRQANVTILHVPYRGGGPALADVAGGQVMAMFATLPSAVSLIKGGKLRAIVVTGNIRSPVFPDVPTGKESGMPDLVVTTWNGVLAPAGTPEPIVARLHQALADAVADKGLKQTFGALGAETELISPEQFSARIKSDFERWSGVIKAAGITVQ